jgi:hypothetical protein
MSVGVEEYQAAVRAAALCAALLRQHDIPKMLAAISRADTVGWAIDPTLYRAKQGAMHEDEKLLESALRLSEFAKSGSAG